MNGRSMIVAFVSGVMEVLMHKSHPQCKQCQWLRYTTKARKYYNTDKYNISKSIQKYYHDGQIPIDVHFDARDMIRFISDNEYDYTIIEAVTGFRG